jgi:hypothetical protein
MVYSSMRDLFFEGDSNHWIKFNLKFDVVGNSEVEWCNVWAWACHHIWMWRNKTQHIEGFVRPSNPSHIILKKVRDYHMAEKTTDVVEMKHNMVFVKWSPPREGWVKLNTDGSCQNGSRIGCGGVIRGKDGEWFGGFC